MICPYCKQEIPSKDFAAKTPQGNYFHMPCADLVLDDWMKMKETLQAIISSHEYWRLRCLGAEHENGKLLAQLAGLREVLSECRHVFEIGLEELPEGEDWPEIRAIRNKCIKSLAALSDRP